MGKKFINWSVIVRCLLGKSVNVDDKLVDEWLNEDLQNQEYYKKAKYYFDTYYSGEKEVHEIDMEKAWAAFEIYTKKIRNNMWRKYLSYAAVVIVFLGIGMVSLLLKDESEKFSTVVHNQTTALGTEARQVKTTLELNEEEKIILDDSQRIEIVSNNGLIFAKDSFQTLIINKNQIGDIKMNTISVPIGCEYKVILADGTNVWINSDSKLKFPTHFSQNERVVELTGEAYFNVAKDTCRPFIIRLGNCITKVLGTSFNISNYPEDEIIQTTLVEGMVEIKYLNKNYLLKPHEQIEISEKYQRATIRKVDTKLFTSWIDGIFRFQDMPLEQLTIKLQRWYNIDFFFAQEECKEYRFTGAVRRDVNFNEFIKLLKKTTNLNFSIKSKTVTISKK